MSARAAEGSAIDKALADAIVAMRAVAVVWNLVIGKKNLRRWLMKLEIEWYGVCNWIEVVIGVDIVVDALYRLARTNTYSTQPLVGGLERKLLFIVCNMPSWCFVRHLEVLGYTFNKMLLFDKRSEAIKRGISSVGRARA